MCKQGLGRLQGVVVLPEGGDGGYSCELRERLQLEQALKGYAAQGPGGAWELFGELEEAMRAQGSARIFGFGVGWKNRREQGEVGSLGL